MDTLSDRVITLKNLVQEAIKADDGKTIRRLFAKHQRVVNEELPVVKMHHGEASGMVRFINMRDEYGFTFLQEASVTGRPKAVAALLEQDAIDVNLRTPTGHDYKARQEVTVGNQTALELAQDKQHGEVIRLLKRDKRVEQELPKGPDRAEPEPDYRQPAALSLLGDGGKPSGFATRSRNRRIIPGF